MPKKYYIHGTNSSIFAFLPLTQFLLESPLSMLHKYKRVTITGEIDCGGHNSVGSITWTGKTAFADLANNDTHTYSLKNIIQNYTHFSIATEAQNLKYFRQSLELGPKILYSNLNLILIFFARARQNHLALTDIITPEALTNFVNDIADIIQFFCFLQLLGNYIHPNFELIAQTKSEIGDDLTDAIYTIFTNDYFIKQIKQKKIDISAILADPTPDNLNPVLQILELPPECEIIGNFNEVKKITLAHTQFFTLSANYPADFISWDAGTECGYIVAAGIGYGANELLEKFFKQSLSPYYFQSLSKHLKKYVKEFRDRFDLFNGILKTDQEAFTEFNSTQKYFLANVFPIILITDDCNQWLKQFGDGNRYEYRSIAPLSIGKDIRLIATDKAINRLKIMKFLELYKITNVQVILFEDLKNLKKGEEPRALFNHFGGVSTLKWLSAQKIIATNKFFDATLRLQKEQNSKSTLELLQIAEEYQSFQFG